MRTPRTQLFYTKIPEDTSAYVADWAIGPDFTNYAFDTTTGTYVGSWEVDQGPGWSPTPAALSGQEAAALLFGGGASDYTISTVDDVFAHADSLAWVSTWGGDPNCTDWPCGTKVAENYVIGTASAAPEPAAWALMMLGIGAVGYSLRKRHRLAPQFG